MSALAAHRHIATPTSNVESARPKLLAGKSATTPTGDGNATLAAPKMVGAEGLEPPTLSL